MQRSNERFVERLPLVLERPGYAYALTSLFCLAALFLRLSADRVLPDGYPFVTFFPAVILTSFLFGIRPGIFAAVVCGLLSWYFLIPPRMAFTFNPAVAIALCFYLMVVSIDIALIHWMQRANFNVAVERERNRALAENRELLFRELQHRVSNNLQVVAAMLSLQRRQVDDAVARRALDDAAARMALIGRISRALYDPAGEGQDVRLFLTTLTADVMAAAGRDDIAVTVIAPDHLVLDPNIAVPMALIVAEAVSNAIEHGLPDRAGKVAIMLDASGDGRMVLTVRDDGKGLAPGFEAGSTCLGLQIAATLARQLGGHFVLESAPGGGAIARLDLPKQVP